MMWHRGEHAADAGSGAGGGADAGAEARSAAEKTRAEELILAAVATEGLPALVHVLLDARSGDSDAAGMRVGALLRARAETTWFTAHDLVSLAGITESTTVGELTPVQRSILTRNLGRGPLQPGGLPAAPIAPTEGPHVPGTAADPGE